MRILIEALTNSKKQLEDNNVLLETLDTLYLYLAREVLDLKSSNLELLYLALANTKLILIIDRCCSN